MAVQEGSVSRYAYTADSISIYRRPQHPPAEVSTGGVRHRHGGIALLGVYPLHSQEKHLWQTNVSLKVQRKRMSIINSRKPSHPPRRSSPVAVDSRRVWHDDGKACRRSSTWI